MAVVREDIAAEYLAGSSVWKIAPRHGICGQRVWQILKDMNVPMRTREQAIRKEPIRTSAFTDPLTKDDAYWLGLLYADGSLVVAKKTGLDTVSLTAHRDDEESIVGFLAHLGLTKPILRRRDKKAVSTLVTSITLGRNLRKLGIVPAKTHTIVYPEWLPQELDRHFVRGYFDGDGSVGFRLKKTYVTPQGAVRFTGNPRFVSGLAGTISHHLGINSSRRVHLAARSAWLCYEGRNQLIRIAEWLYSDGGPSLSRKRNALFSGLKLEG